MEEKRNKKKKIRNVSVGSLLVTLILYAIFGTVYGVLLWWWGKACYEVHYQYAAIKAGIIVEADLTRVEVYPTGDYRYHDPSHVQCYVVYEYQDGDIKYEGTGLVGIRGRENAEKYLGRKINIYIDGKGHSIAVGGKPNTSILIGLTIFVVVLFYPMLFWPLLLKQINKRKEKIKLRKQQNKPSFSIYVRPNDSQDKDK
ncbi:MAG: hypothetical protein K2N53_00880 [Clostridia bacterium]|nr:hypothetical protein [Clostridia bacterium]